MGKAARWLPWLLPLVAVLPDPGAALPRLSYYFRDFTVTFYPLRLFVARELREGRWPFWNPFLHEGTFAFPAFYPLDLLLALSPAPETLSWLLTLHLPLAALAAYALGRELGLGPLGAFAAGSVYALGGFALSSLNLVVFLQALALAPLVVLGMRRAAGGAARQVAAAAALLALAISTLAVEFVGQAVLLGLALGLAARPARVAALRLLAVLGLGFALAALPIGLVLGMLPETQRGLGFGPDVLYANSLHPLALAQAVVPNLFGPLDVPPAEVFWGASFFSKGFPYFLSLYLGPCVLALAAAGLAGGRLAERRLLAGLALLALWFSLGEQGLLARAVYSLPGLSAFRFPGKAYFLVHFAAAFLAGAGLDRVAEGGRPRALAAVAGGLAAGAAAAAASLLAWPELASRLFGLRLGDPAALAGWLAADLAKTAAVALVALLVWWALRAGHLAPGRAAALLAAVVAADLARAGAGLNAQVPGRLLRGAPELAGLGLDSLDGQRVFSLETERSRALGAFLASGAPRRSLLSFVAHRRVLAPYTNILDGVETAWGKDLTSFGGAAPELAPEDYDPGRLAALLPQLRAAAVSRILSLDELEAPGLRLLAEAPAGPAGVRVRAYGLEPSLPIAYLACRVRAAAGPAEAFARSLAPDFDAGRDVALEGPAAAGCTRGSVRRLEAVPGREHYEAEADGTGFLVVRASYARGWRASVGEEAAPVLRANGKYRAVPLGAGRHRVTLRYEPPGLRPSLTVSALALLACVLLLRRGGRPGRPRPLL